MDLRSKLINFSLYRFVSCFYLLSELCIRSCVVALLVTLLRILLIGIVDGYEKKIDLATR